ncbi:MAG TPA: glycosyltransferase [Nocardioidaceae bacterium]|nr:glycosyltransferase [Nocardioidaceae bacterium]
MRIAMVSEHASPLADVGSVDAGGQNVHVAALAKGLVERGHDVTVFTRRDDPSLGVRITSSDGYVVEHVAAGPPTDIPKDELLKHMPAFADYLENRWLSERFDIVHSHFWMSGMASVAAAAAAEIPVVHTFHALGTVKRRHQGGRDTSPPERIAIEMRLCRTVDRVVATCRDEITELRALGMNTHRATVVPCGVDVSSFVPTPRPPTGPPRLLVLGRLVERKGVGNVITALAELPGVELVIAGGPERDALSADPEVCRLRKLAEDNGSADRVTFVGRVHRGDVPTLISSVDVVVAVPWYEPFGIVPLEAMACGRPVVGSAVGGLLDTIVPGHTGELVPPRRPDILAATLRSLLADPDRQAAYGRAGYERAVRIYRWEQVAAATEAVYASVLERAPHAASAEAVR